MIKTIMTLLMLLVPTVATAETNSFFAQNVIGETKWRIFGTIFNDPIIYDKCTAQISWEDGSYWQLTKNLNDGTMRIVIHNTDWQITDAPQTKMTVQVNAYNGRKFVDGSTLEFTLIDKNTMFSETLNIKPFLEGIYRSQRMIFVPPGTIPNINVSWGESNGNIIGALGDCIIKGNAIKNASEKRPNNDAPVGNKGFKVTPDISPLTGKKGEPI